MLFFDGGVGLLFLLLWVYGIFEVITTDEARIRNLPKLTWLLIVILLSDIGSVAWLVAGRPQGAARSLPDRADTGVPPEYDRPGRATAQSPDDDAAFLSQLRARAEEQRKKAAEQARLLRQQEDEPPPP
ncbi:MAG: hypothetical protein QOG99_3535 [Frankiales bacterium]|nr:hypothetical protein [Frankiales bacterium]